METTTEREPLTMESITTAALGLIDRDGLEGLSMRRLGKALGYEAMALYKHVADKSALLDAVVETVYEEMTSPDGDASWQERIRHVAQELRGVARRHPHLFVRVVTEPPPSRAVLTRVDTILAALRESGADDDSVMRNFWLFVNLTSGALLAEATALTRPQSTALTDGTLDQLVECRVLIEFGDRIAACDFGVEFEHAVDAFISIVES